MERKARAHQEVDEGMNEGMRYEVIFKLAHQKLPRRMVGVFLGVSNKELQFSLRPTFGTTTITREQLVMYRQTVEPISAPAIYRGETV